MFLGFFLPAVPREIERGVDFIGVGFVVVSITKKDLQLIATFPPVMVEPNKS